MPVLCQCLECGAHFPSSLDMTVCVCGGELVNATTHGKHDPLCSDELTPADRKQAAIDMAILRVRANQDADKALFAELMGR